MIANTRASQYVINTYLFVMLAIFPLVTNGNYFDILDIKWIACVIPTILFLIVWLVMLIATKKSVRKTNSSYRLFAIFTALLIISVIIGMAMCRSVSHLKASFWGVTGRYLGVMVIVPLCLAILVIAKRYTVSPLLLYFLGISSAIIFILQILHEFKIDSFNMWVGMPRDQIKLFASTIGNINFNATYNCIVLSIFMTVLVLMKRSNSDCIRNRVLLITLIALGFAGSICTRSNGFYLGIAATFIVLFIYVLKNMDCLNRLLLLLAIWIASSSLVALMYRTAEHRFELRSISGMMIQPEIIHAELALLMALFLASRFMGPRVIRIVLVVTGVVALLGAVWLVTAGPDSFIHFSDINDHTGHNRVYVWRRTLDMLSSYSSLGWLFGCGINEFQFAFSDFCGDEMRALGYNIFIDAHSEYLQSIAATGICGCIGYWGLIVSTIISNMKAVNRNPISIIAVVCLVTFMAQGLVYGPQITTTPLILLLVGIFRSEINESRYI